MDEVLVDVFNLAKSEGYQGDINSFKELISTNKDAYDMAFNSFTSRGYTGGEEDFSSLIQISQPKPKDAGTYQINNTPATREDVMLNLQNPEFKQNVQNGNINLNVQNDESLRPYINGNVVSSSDGEFTVDVSGTVNLGGKQYSYDELTTQLNGDTDRAIKMFVNQTPIDAVIKSPQKTKLELRLSPETEKKQEQEKLQKDALKSKGDLYNKYLIEDYYLFARNDDYESSSGMIDETFAAIGDGLDAVEKLVQFDYVSEEKANNREAVEKQQEKVTDIVDRIIDPLYQENKSKYVNDGKVNQDYTIEDNEGFLIPNGAKILKEISKPESSEYIKDVNLRMKYLSDIVSTIDLNINAPQEKVQEQSEENYIKEYGKSFQEEIDESARLEFKEKYADDIDKITSSYTTEVDFLIKKANSDIENYTAPLNKQYNTTLQAYQQKAKQLEQEKGFATSIGDLKIIESQLDKLTNDYNDVVGQRTKQQLSFISKRNNKLNNQIQLLNDKRNNSLKELSTDFSKTFNISEELLDKYNDVYKKSFDEVYDKSARAKEKVMIARTKFGSPDDNIIEMLGGEPTRLGARIANVTLSALLETAYNTSTATFGVDPESAYFLRQESKQRVPAPVGLKKFSDLGESEGVYRLLESTGQLVGSMAPALGAAAVTAVATKNLPMTTRMILIGGAQWGAESENLASRAYNDAIERTGSVSTAKKARSETLDLQIALLPTYYFQALPFVGGFSKIANPLLRVLAGGTLEYSTEIIQELPQQLGEESIFKYGEFEKMGEFLSKGKFEEVAVNVLPTFGIGTVGSMNADAGLQMSRLIEKYPEMSRQYLANFVYQNSDKRNLATGKAKAQFALSTLYTNGKIDEETAIKLGLFVNSITNNNSLSYTILNAKRSDLKVALEQETDEVKQTIIKKQLNELSSEMENILLGKESNITEIKIGDVRYQFTPSEVENTNVVEDIQSLKNNIEQPAETTTEETTEEAPLVTDESGEVVTVYRGGKSTSGVQYYTSDEKLAEGIGEGKGEGVQKATVRMANPWTPETLDVNNAPQWMQDWVRSREEFTTVDEETMAAEEISMEQAIQEIKDMQLSFRDVGLWQSFVNEALEHHDGIIAFDPSEDMATDKKIYITKSPEQVVTEETTEAVTEETTAEETTEELGSEVKQIAKLEAERTKTEDTTEETTEDTTDELTSVDVAKDQLKSAWESWKEQQKTLGVVFDPQSKADEDIALARAIIDYLREIGAKSLSDVNRAVRQFTNNGITVNSKGARYLLFESKKDTKGKVVSQALNKYYDNRLNRIRTNFVQTIQNSYIKLLKIQKTAAKLGIKITDRIDVILNKELQQNRTVARQQKINDLFANFIKEYVQKAGLTIEELGLYMYAIHAPIRNKVLKERAIKNGETENIDDLSGMTDEQAKEILESIPDNMKPVYEALAKKFREQTLTETVKVLEDSGKVTKEKAKELLDNFEGTYVPLQVKEDMLGEFDVNSSPKTIRTKGKVIYKAKGSNFFTAKDRVNPVVQAHLAHLKAISISEEQRTFKSLVGLAKAINDSDVFKVVTRAKTRPDKGIEGSIDGKTAYVIIQDKELFDIMNANDGQLAKLPGGKFEFLTKMLQSFNSWFRTVNTLANPSFIVTNFERDLQSALINISSEDVKNLGSQFIKNVPSAVRGLAEYQLGKRDTEWAKIYQELIDAGGQISWQDLSDIDKVKKEIKKIENKYKNKKGKNDLLNYSKEMYSAVGNLMGGLNNVAEMSSRLAAFQAARDAGMTDARAAQLALNLTVNFQKKGTAGVVINALYVFSNAGIQGSAVILKNLSKKGKGGNRARIIAGSIVAASYMNALLNDMFDDDEDEESYADDDSIQMLSDYQRERNMIFMIPKELGGTGDKITVPLPYGYNVFWVAGQAAYDFTAGKKDLGQSMSMMGGAVMNAFNPIGGTGDLVDLAPTILKSALEIYTNKNYKGDPIKPDYDIPGMAKRRESSKYFKSVSPASKEITDFLNEFTGGDEIVAGDIDISPEYIDHLSKFIAGGAGTFLNNAITTGIGTVGKEPIPIRDIPFVRKHYSEPYPEARVNFIYDVYENRETQQLTPYDEQLFINSLVYSLKNDLIEPEKAKKIIKGYIDSKDLQDRANQEVYPMFTEKELRKTKKIEKESLKKLKKLIDE